MVAERCIRLSTLDVEAKKVADVDCLRFKTGGHLGVLSSDAHEKEKEISTREPQIPKGITGIGIGTIIL